MTREELSAIVMDELAKIEKLFAFKSEGYGGNQDGLYNFRSTAKRFFGEDTPDAMYNVLAILRDKHDCTLAKNGLSDPMFEERMRDSVVYGLIALAIHREAGRALVKLD